MSLHTTVTALASGLVAAGLHDDAARLIARAGPEQDRLEASERATGALHAVQEHLRRLLADVEVLRDGVVAGLDARWRSPAAREHADRAAEFVDEVRRHVAEAEGRLALCAAALREAEAEAVDARTRLAEAQAVAEAMLRASAVAA